MQASPWFVEVVNRAPRWHRTVWLVGLLMLSVSVGWALALTGARFDNRRDLTGHVLTQTWQGIELARLRAGAHAGCPEALAAATQSRVFDRAVDAWHQPLEIRCYADTLVLRSTGEDLHDPFDDVVVVAPMAAQASRAVSALEGVR